MLPRLIAFRIPSAMMATPVVGFLIMGSCGAIAKDLYVSPSGSDSVSYTANSISSPWRSVDHGLYNLQAGDHLYIRGGTYTPSYPVWLSSDYNRQTKGGSPAEVLNSASGTSSQPVTIENYPGETPVIDLRNVSGGYVRLDNKSYWTFRGLTFVNSDMVFVVGEDYPSTHNTFENLTVTANRGGDNVAAIHLWGSNADYVTIKGCKLTGPGQSVHLNTGAIYINKINHAKIIGNTLSNAPIGIYFKHRNAATAASQVDVEIAYNYITNTSRASLEYNGMYTNIHDNVFGAGTAAAHFGDSNGGPGGDYNSIAHNTFSVGALNFDSTLDSTDPFPGAIGNKVANNIFKQNSDIMRYTSAPSLTVWGINLFPGTDTILSNRVSVSLPVGSLVGAPTFIGGATPATVAGFALASGGLGKLAASDGKDLGADISAIVSGSVSSPTPAPAIPPSAPALLQIQTQ